MKKSMSARTFVAFSLSAKTTQLKTYGCIAIVFLAGCTNTQVRWDATKMRKDVMVYYNDQIMDNLIRAKNKLPFVHVDIQSLTSQGASQISGTIGAGETRTHTDSAASSIMKAVTRPFTYSVTPQQTETLSIIAAPALGTQALAAPTPAPGKSSTPTPTPKLELTKETETIGGDGEIMSTKTERTLKPAPTPKSITIYKLYEDFAERPPQGHLSENEIRPKKGTFVPGTLKEWRTEDRTEYYFIANNDKEAYYNFCKALFTKGQAGSLEKKLEVIEAQAAIR